MIFWRPRGRALGGLALAVALYGDGLCGAGLCHGFPCAYCASFRHLVADIYYSGDAQRRAFAASAGSGFCAVGFDVAQCFAVSSGRLVVARSCIFFMC